MQLAVLLAGALFPIIFAALVFFRSGRLYANWAKVSSIIACAAALIWGTLGWLLVRSRGLGLTRDAYYKLVSMKGLFGGLCLGFILSILLARPYTKRARARADLPKT
jgi:hypothetical protein